MHGLNDSIFEKLGMDKWSNQSWREWYQILGCLENIKTSKKVQKAALKMYLYFSKHTTNEERAEIGRIIDEEDHYNP